MRRTVSSVASLTSSGLFRARDTVMRETPASFATSVIVTLNWDSSAEGVFARLERTGFELDMDGHDTVHNAKRKREAVLSRHPGKSGTDAGAPALEVLHASCTSRLLSRLST